MADAPVEESGSPGALQAALKKIADGFFASLEEVRKFAVEFLDELEKGPAEPAGPAPPEAASPADSAVPPDGSDSA